MTNDEARMTKEARMTNSKRWNIEHLVRHSDFRHSFVIRASSFVICPLAGCAWVHPWRGTPPLLDLQQLNVEVQFRVGRDDVAGAAGAVAEFGRDDELARAANFHAGDAFVPALDDLAGAERKRERLAAVFAAVEFLA